MSERPLIQIDDIVRPMTDEEYEEWLNRPVFDSPFTTAEPQ